MWPITRAGLIFLKSMLPFYYISNQGKKEAYVSFGNHVKFCVRINTHDAFILNEIWKNKCYEKAEIMEDDVVVDIGAHIGGYSVFANKKGGRVISYEAMPENYRLLKRNLEINKCEEVAAFNSAVSSKNGKINFYLSSQGNGMHSIHQDSVSGKALKIPSVTLRDVFDDNKLRKIDVLKIDVEGAEYEIILSASGNDLKTIKTIVLEYHDYLDRKFKVDKLTAVLENNGFAVQKISPWYQNLLFKSGIILANRNGIV